MSHGEKMSHLNQQPIFSWPPTVKNRSRRQVNRVKYTFDDDEDEEDDVPTYKEDDEDEDDFTLDQDDDDSDFE